jgi:hypothetical protein
MDEHDGKGGLYEVDPKTGARRLIERTGEAVSAPPVEPQQPAALVENEDQGE